MKAKIAKDFHWEMCHRLPFHKGPCKNIHGHSYKMRIELEGETNGDSMILDFYDIEQVVGPLVDKFDHSFICDEADKDTIEFLEMRGFKYNVISDYTTAENLASVVLGEIAPKFAGYENISRVTVRLFETEDAFAEVSRDLK